MTEDQPIATEWRILPAELISALARRLIEVEPLLHRAGPEQVLARLGWRVVEDASEFLDLIKADSGLGLAGWSAELWLDPEDHGRVASVSASVCDNAIPVSAASGRLSLEAFALAGQALAAELGPPTGAQAGMRPRIDWRGDGFTVQLTRDSTCSTLVLKRNADLDAAKAAGHQPDASAAPPGESQARAAGVGTGGSRSGR